MPGHADRDRRVEHALAVADQIDAEAAQVHDDALGAELQQLGRRDAGDRQVMCARERAHARLGARVVEAGERPLVGAERLEPALELHDVGAAGAQPQHGRAAQALGRVDGERPGLGPRRVAGRVDRRDREAVNALRETLERKREAPRGGVLAEQRLAVAPAQRHRDTVQLRVHDHR
jgi:hypothetical protein